MITQRLRAPRAFGGQAGDGGDGDVRAECNRAKLHSARSAAVAAPLPPRAHQSRLWGRPRSIEPAGSTVGSSAWRWTRPRPRPPAGGQALTKPGDGAARGAQPAPEAARDATRGERHCACAREQAVPAAFAAWAAHLVQRDRGLGANTPAIILLLQKHWQRIGATEADARRQVVQRHGRDSRAPLQPAERWGLWARACWRAPEPHGLHARPAEPREFLLQGVGPARPPGRPQPRASLRGPRASRPHSIQSGAP